MIKQDQQKQTIGSKRRAKNAARYMFIQNHGTTPFKYYGGIVLASAVGVGLFYILYLTLWFGFAPIGQI